MGRASVFENRKWVPLFAGSAALSWACAFPLIKLGLADFGIAGTDTGGKALFIIYDSPEDGIGIPISLKGFKEGFDALP